MTQTEIIKGSIKILRNNTPCNANRKRKKIIKHIYICSDYNGYTFQQIADIFWLNSHCSVISAIKSVNNQMDTNYDYKSEIEELHKRIIFKRC